MKTEKLTSIIAEKGVTNVFLAKKLGLPISTFQNKLHGRSEFKASEIAKLGNFLALSPEEFYDTFFSC